MMASVFDIKPASAKAGPGDPNWAKLGLSKNPFPESGVLGSTLYTAHMPDVFSRVSRWLSEVVRAEVGTPRGPFAIEGTIGAGKTHILVAMENQLNGLRLPTGMMVLRENLVNAGGGKLLLSTLFGANLRLGEIAETVIGASGLPKAMDRLPSASPIRAALGSKTTAATLALWLRGGPLSASQLQTVGGRTLDGEGERLRAVIHLLRLSAHLGHLHAVVFLLDQLEDLERRSEITPLRRARFLTDLRIFIDEGLEGAPIALCTAWNTEGAAFMKTLQGQYPALASRLDNRATVPGLPQAHLLPFAQAYLDAAYDKAKQKLHLDTRTVASLAGTLRQLPGGDLSPREWLDQLRQWAEREAMKG